MRRALTEILDAGTLPSRSVGMSNRLRICLLGGLRVEHSGRTLTRFRTRKTGSVLAYLAYHAPREVSRDVLAERFWPDDSAQKGRGSLNTAIHSLRQQLGAFSTLPDAFLIADRNTVRMNDALVWTDVEAFRKAAAVALGSQGDRATALQEALDLYKGELLEGYYDEWIVSEAIALSETHEALLGLERPQPTLGSSVSSPARPVSKDNLPRITNPFIGRDAELERLDDLHERFPLVAIVGMGGVGKTRLALELGRRLLEKQREVWLIEFAAAPPDVSLAEEVIRQLEISGDSSPPPIARLASHFAARPATLIFDNLEHLEDPERELSEILRSVRTVKLLVTSRTRPRLQQQEALELEPLSVPNTDEDLESLRANPSASLFISRAATAAPGFSLHARNAAAIGELCRRLEGISLAIELAAARAQVYTVREMVEQMDRPMDFLVSRVKDRADRHRSLRSTIEWSYRRLTPWSRATFPKLATAKGGWTLAMAEKVLETPGLGDLLHELIDASLIRRADVGKQRRFSMHEVVREFGLMLLPPEQFDQIQERRLDSLIEYVDIDGPNGGGSGLKDWLDRVALELENIRDCLGWAWQNGREEKAATLATRLHTFWDRRGYYREASLWLERAVGGEALPKELRASVLRTAGGLRADLGEYVIAERHLQEACDLFEELGDTVRHASVLNSLGNIMHWTGRHDAAEQCYTQSLEERRSESDPGRLGIPLVNMANLAVDRTRFKHAEGLYLEALAIGRSKRDAFLIQGVLNNLATLLIRTGRFKEVEPLLEEAWSLNVELGHPHGSSHILGTRAELAYRSNRMPEAIALVDQSLAGFEDLNEARCCSQQRLLKAKVVFLTGDSMAAEVLLRQSVHTLGRVEDRRLLAETRSILALAVGSRDPGAATAYLLEAFDSLSGDHESVELHNCLAIAAHLTENPAIAAASIKFYESTGADIEPIIRALLDRFARFDAGIPTTAEAERLAVSRLSRSPEPH